MSDCSGETSSTTAPPDSVGTNSAAQSGGVDVADAGSGGPVEPAVSNGAGCDYDDDAADGEGPATNVANEKSRRKKKAKAVSSVFENTPACSRADVSAGGDARGVSVSEARSVFESKPRASSASVGYCVSGSPGVDAGPCVFESAPRASVADVKAEVKGNAAEAARAEIQAAAEYCESADDPEDRRRGANAADEARAVIMNSAEAYEDSANQTAQFTFESAPVQSKAHVRHGQDVASESEYEYETDSEEEEKAQTK